MDEQFVSTELFDLLELFEFLNFSILELFEFCDFLTEVLGFHPKVTKREQIKSVKLMRTN